MAKDLTEKNLFKKPRYRAIMDLIVSYSDPDLERRLTTEHLKYALVKSYKPVASAVEQEMKAFFIQLSPSQQKRFHEDLAQASIKYHLTKPRAQLLATMNKLDYLRLIEGFREKDYFGSVQALRDALTRLKKLGLIESKKYKKKNYYQATLKGKSCCIRLQIHEIIEDVFKIEDVIKEDDIMMLADLLGIVLTLAFAHVAKSSS